MQGWQVSVCSPGPGLIHLHDLSEEVSVDGSCEQWCFISVFALCSCTVYVHVCAYVMYGQDRTGMLLTFQSGIMVWVLMKINVNATSCISGLPSCLAK